MTIDFGKLAGVSAAVLLIAAGSAFAQGGGGAPESGIAHERSMLEKGKVPPPTRHCTTAAINAHSAATREAIAKYAAVACDHLAHHFVGTFVHAQFLRECHNSFHGTLTCVPAGGAGGAGAGKDAAKDKR